jgi:hypothetical protein
MTKSYTTETAAARPPRCTPPAPERLVGCPLCPSRARLTHGRRGWFYSCVRFPACRGSKPVAPKASTSERSDFPQGSDTRPLYMSERGACSFCGRPVDAATGEIFTDGGRAYYRHRAGSEACAGAVIAAAGRMPL